MRRKKAMSNPRKKEKHIHTNEIIKLSAVAPSQTEQSWTIARDQNRAESREKQK